MCLKYQIYYVNMILLNLNMLDSDLNKLSQNQDTYCVCLGN